MKSLPSTLKDGRAPVGPGPADVGSLVIVAAGGALWWLSLAYPAELPSVAPWHFSWTEFLGTTLPAFWYGRGLALSRPDQRPNLARQLAFVAGIVLIYAVLQTRFVYMSQHMFFLNRLQHLAMHHLGPFLIALSWPGAMIARGMPAWARPVIETTWLKRLLHLLQNPVLACLLFVGLIALWLQPDVHFRAMISPVLYRAMNWSMVVDGLLFWFLVLDPRPAPAARISAPMRLASVMAVVFPQILIGARLTFGTKPLYAYYDLCGRLFPSVSALHDQHLGGLIVWIPSSMMSAAAFMLIVNNVRLQEDRACNGNGTNDIRTATGVVVSSTGWTGR